MDEHLPPEGIAPVPAERIVHERAVRHVVQAHPNDLVDPWWMNEALTRDYREILYKEWGLDLEDVDPAYVDERLPDGVGLVRRGTMLNSRRMECVFEIGEALAAVALARRRLWIGVAGRDLASVKGSETSVGNHAAHSYSWIRPSRTSRRRSELVRVSR